MLSDVYTAQMEFDRPADKNKTFSLSFIESATLNFPPSQIKEDEGWQKRVEIEKKKAF